MKYRRHKVAELATFLSRECAQTRPGDTLTLSVISGTSVLAFTRFSDTAANSIAGLLRLFL
jgi:hypothetical protein